MRKSRRRYYPKRDLDATKERLLKLSWMESAEALEGLLAEAVKEGMLHHRFLHKLLDVEIHNREERRIRTSRKLSGLPKGQTLESFDFAFQPPVERSRIETLGTYVWIRGHATLLNQGPPGVGKTHLAVAL